MYNLGIESWSFMGIDKICSYQLSQIVMNFNYWILNQEGLMTVLPWTPVRDTTPTPIPGPLLLGCLVVGEGLEWPPWGVRCMLWGVMMAPITWALLNPMIPLRISKLFYVFDQSNIVVCTCLHVHAKSGPKAVTFKCNLTTNFTIFLTSFAIFYSIKCKTSHSSQILICTIV